MSSVPSLPTWRLPVLALTPTSKRRRAMLAGGGLLLVAAATLVASGTVRLRHESAAAPVPSAEFTAARAHAVALARAKAGNAAPSAAVKASRAPPSRVADASRAADLFAAHSWYVPPPPPPPAPPAPPAAPAAPPFPYTYVGSYTPEGDVAVFFLARGDRVVDAHVGDHLDGVYEFVSADGGQLVFNYLPLDIRQSVPGGVDR